MVCIETVTMHTVVFRPRQTQIFRSLGAVSRLNEPYRSAKQLSRPITNRVTTFGLAFYGPRR